MTDITLYWDIISQPARAVKTLIDIGKIPCTFNKVDLLRGQQKKKAYTEMYPIGKIPVLKAGDFVLGESGAIMIYLCERYPNLTAYYGETLEQRAITNQYISWYQNYFRHFLVGPVRNLLTALVAKKPVQEQQQKTLVDGLFEALATLETILTKSKTKFIAGNTVTIADILIFYEMTNLILLGLEHDKYKEVKRWHAEVYQVPEVKAITHEWFQGAKQIAKMFQSIEVVKTMPKL